jgi:PAS domain-containing protein
MSESDVSRRWTQQISQLRRQISHVRNRAAKGGRDGVSFELGETFDQCLTTCDSLLWEVAASQRECATLAATAQMERELWDYLFQQMPVACVEVDAQGTIVSANRPAGLMLNIAARHLEKRLLLHFAEDRELFFGLMRRISLERTQHQATLVLRPRERAAIAVQAIIVPRTADAPTSWLWFLSVLERPEYRSKKAVTAARQTDDGVGPGSGAISPRVTDVS